MKLQIGNDQFYVTWKHEQSTGHIGFSRGATLCRIDVNGGEYSIAQGANMAEGMLLPQTFRATAFCSAKETCFSKATGRKVSLTRAMEIRPFFTREMRTAIWNEYWKQCGKEAERGIYRKYITTPNNPDLKFFTSNGTAGTANRDNVNLT